MPTVVLNVLTLTEDPNANAKDIEKILQGDPALCAKLLRVVNSAYFGMQRQVTTVNQAIVVLGYRHLRNLVLAVSALSLFKSSNPRMREVQQVLWEQGFGAAAISSEICRLKDLRTSAHEIAFVGALLHDIGQLFLCSSFTATYTDLINRAEAKGMDIVAAERMTLGMDHAELGEELAQRWSMPPALSMLIGRHEGPFKDDRDPIALCVHASARIAVKISDPDALIILDPVCDAWLGLSESYLDSLVRRTVPKVKEMASLMGMMAA